MSRTRPPHFGQARLCSSEHPGRGLPGRGRLVPRTSLQRSSGSPGTLVYVASFFLERLCSVQTCNWSPGRVTRRPPPPAESHGASRGSPRSPASWGHSSVPRARGDRLLFFFFLIPDSQGGSPGLRFFFFKPLASAKGTGSASPSAARRACRRRQGPRGVPSTRGTWGRLEKGALGVTCSSTKMLTQRSSSMSFFFFWKNI